MNCSRSHTDGTDSREHHDGDTTKILVNAGLLGDDRSAQAFHEKWESLSEEQREELRIAHRIDSNRRALGVYRESDHDVGPAMSPEQMNAALVKIRHAHKCRSCNAVLEDWQPCGAHCSKCSQKLLNEQLDRDQANNAWLYIVLAILFAGVIASSWAFFGGMNP